MNKQSILEMAKGEIMRHTDCELSRVVDNILDIGAEAGAKRTLTLTLTFVPSADRKMIRLVAQAKSKLAPAEPIATTLGMAADANGIPTLTELVPEVPGQMDLDGQEQEEPDTLTIYKRG